MKNHLLTWSVALLAMATMTACGGNNSKPTTSSKDSSQGTSIVSSDSEEGTSEEGTSEEDTSEEGTSEEGTSEEESSEEADVTVTFKITVTNLGTRTLSVGTSFNGWSATANPLSAEGNDVYSWTYSAKAGTSFQYKYIINGSGADWDTLNATDRNYTMPAASTEVNDGSYELTPLGQDVTATFTVNMAGVDLTGLFVYMVGDFNNWGSGLVDAWKMALTTDAIYSIQVTQPENTTIQFKFVVYDGVGTNPTWERSSQGNRSFTFTSDTTTYSGTWNA